MRSLRARWTPIALLLAVALPAAAATGAPPLLPRAEFFADAVRTYPQVAPDGTRLGWLAADDNGILQIQVGALDGRDGKAVTAESRPIRSWWWSGDARSVLFLQDTLGDENHHLLSADLVTGRVRDLTPFRGVRVEDVFVSANRPRTLVVALNLRDPGAFDLYRVDLDTGAVTPEAENPGGVVSWTLDAALEVRGALRLLPDGGAEALVRASREAAWQPVARGALGDDLAVLSVSEDGRIVHLLSSAGADRARVLALPLPSGPARVIAEHPSADALNAVVDRRTGRIGAVRFEHLRSEWKALAAEVEGLLRAVARIAPGADVVPLSTAAPPDAPMSWDRERRLAVVALAEDRAPTRFALYDATRGEARLVFAERSTPGTPAEVRPVTIRARDGLALPSYLALPPGLPPRKLPLVLLVHGGPAWRDSWPWHPVTQWLANRGYAVLRVNFRASTGFGKAHAKAGYGQLGRKMQDDLSDAVTWAVKEGVADQARIAIMGKSYGGYASLVGAALTPDLFRCAVSYVGVADLEATVRSFPAYWGPALTQIHALFGNPDVPAERARMREVSPIHLADRIRIPLLVGQGANDVRVKRAEADAIFGAVERRGGRATYVLYPDEGHGPPGVGPDSPANRIDWYARVEAFLAEHLGGRAEPLDGPRAAGSTAVVREAGTPAARPAGAARP